VSGACAGPYDALMDGTRTQNWWLIRFELAVAIGLIAATAFVGWATTWGGSMHRDAITLGPLFMPTGTFVTIVALAVALVGLVWMFRIARGPRDPAPDWRYRGR
jgi:nitrate reductase NapE component